MPLNDFRCACGLLTEAIRPSGTDSIACPCGRDARRIPPTRFGITGPTTDLRGMYRRFTEATAEIDHAASKIEASTGQPVQTPDFWGQAKARADAMVSANESPVPNPAGAL